ncbi:MAG: hypothetical protein Q8N58_01375 [bacterium]|nr:hypothetical protein [bacterium]
MSNKGFTILELLGAILVILIGVLTAYGVVQRIVTYTIDSSDRITAAYLAKEGVELVRNIRDKNWIANLSWNQGLGAGTYEIAYDTALTACLAPCVDFNSANLRLLKNSASSAYNYSYNYVNGTNSKFKRKITITPDGTNKIKVIVDIFWKKRIQISSIRVQENIYDWK